MLAPTKARIVGSRHISVAVAYHPETAPPRWPGSLMGLTRSRPKLIVDAMSLHSQTGKGVLAGIPEEGH